MLSLFLMCLWECQWHWHTALMTQVTTVPPVSWLQFQVSSYMQQFSKWINYIVLAHEVVEFFFFSLFVISCYESAVDESISDGEQDVHQFK